MIDYLIEIANKINNSMPLRLKAANALGECGEKALGKCVGKKAAVEALLDIMNLNSEVFAGKDYSFIAP